MAEINLDSLNVRRTLTVGGKEYDYFSLEAAEAAGIGAVSRLPYALKVVLENLLRHEDGENVTLDDVRALPAWLAGRRLEREIALRPARVVMPDSSGVAVLLELAAMRDAMAALGGDPARVNPKVPVDVIVDHSVIVDVAGQGDALARNMEIELDRNRERFAFLRWGQLAFDGVRVVPPGRGIIHQVNLEYLAQVVWTEEAGGRTLAYPDTLLGTDSHTPMINSLGVLGWGVGGLEGGATMLGQPVAMLLPEVVGCRLSGHLGEGVTTTDLVLRVTEVLRAHGVVGKFVEFFGPGVDALPLAERATLANMAPEYGATMGFFPIDRETVRYLELTGREPARVALVEAYAKAQGLWRETGAPDPDYTEVVDIDLGAVETSIAGPKRPQDRVRLKDAASLVAATLAEHGATDIGGVALAGSEDRLRHGDIVLAGITSCTNTSNPSVMVAAGLLAQKAVARGLEVKPWVKTSLAPGSRVVADYLAAAGLQAPLDRLGFHIVGFGCTTCMGNSGPLAEPVATAIAEGDLVVGAVLSGNRNYEGRIHNATRLNFLASPPLVVAYAIAGRIGIDMLSEPLGAGSDGAPVFLRDIWPSNREIDEAIADTLSPDLFRARYEQVFEGGPAWQAIGAAAGTTFAWDESSTYLRPPPYFDGVGPEPAALTDIRGARPLAILGDTVTTDHISLIATIAPDGPAGQYLRSIGVEPKDFNSFVGRRGNHEVCMRGTFANARLRNEMVPGVEGGFTRHAPSGEQMTIFDAAMRYKADGVPLVVIAGKEYGAGSSRDWAAKGTQLFGVRAVIAEGFERIHRANLVCMGVLPLEFTGSDTRHTLAFDGSETLDITGITGALTPRMEADCAITRASGESTAIRLRARLDTLVDVHYIRHGGVLPYALRTLLERAA